LRSLAWLTRWAMAMVSTLKGSCWSMSDLDGYRQFRIVRRSFPPNPTWTNTKSVETIKKQLGTSDEQRSHVDWLTEVIKRLSDAFATGHNFATVNMKNVSRTEKVFWLVDGQVLGLTLYRSSGSPSRHDIRTSLGPRMRRAHSKTALSRTDQSSALYAKRSGLANARRLRSYAIMPTGRTRSSARRTNRSARAHLRLSGHNPSYCLR
jgi:hypothetical protein